MFNTNVCRLCAKVCDNLIHIFNGSENKDRMDLKIKKCLPNVMIVEDDSKPKQICLSCTSKLEMCNNFLDDCNAAEAKFDAILTRLVSLQEIAKDDESLLKQNDNCFWVEDELKDNNTLSVQHEGSVIVLSKMGANMLDQQHEKSQDFLVMLELKCKDNIPEKGIMTEVGTLSVSVKDIDTITFTNSSDILSKNNLLKTIDIRSGNRNEDEFTSREASYRYKIEKLSMDGKKDEIGSDCETKYEMNARKHEDLTKNNKQNEKKSFACTICNAKFVRITRLNSHMALHTDVRPHACDQCDKTFAMRWDLTLHQRLHSRAFECEFCNKLFNARSKLERHRRTHTGERPFQCQHCQRAFGEKRNLENHVRTHTGERPFVCDICYRSFSVRSHLKDHQRVHTKATPYCCDICDKVFKWKANYKLHLKIHSQLKAS